VTAGLPSGLRTQSTQLGVWEPTGDRSVHLKGMVLHSDAEGNFTGSFSYDGFHTVSEDGLTIRADDGGTATFRDADGEVSRGTRGRRWRGRRHAHVGGCAGLPDRREDDGQPSPLNGRRRRRIAWATPGMSAT
jgi:hypothetical protein